MFLKKIKKYAFLIILIFIICFSSFPKQTSASGMAVIDALSLAYDTVTSIWDKMWKIAEQTYDKLGSQALQQITRSAANKLAYDYATYLGSGGEGQKPMFMTKGWGQYLKETGDTAAGQFIEYIGKNNSFAKFNLCEPNINVKISIGLGLYEGYKEKMDAPACTFSKMRDNWEAALEDPKFLNKFQDMFDPTSNDLGIALTLNQKMIEEKEKKTHEAELLKLGNKGWLDVTGLIDNKIYSVPGWAESQFKDPKNSMILSFGKFTGDAMIDAANTFLNTYALTLFNTKMAKLGKKDTGDGPEDQVPSWLNRPDSSSPTSGGSINVQQKLKQIIQPSFVESGEIDILADLTMCQNPTKAGPTNCVISQKFADAVRTEKTVGQAMKEGYLDPDAPFGFLSDGQEPVYNQGYSYRSMIILRKYRIIPVGWELAAQYIKNNSTGGNGSTQNLNDLVSCFSKNDDYSGYYENWCKGLVDPNWVLKLPQNFCKKEGPGPEITSSQVMKRTEADNNGDMTSWNEIMLTRNENYCADEQSCIKENKNGTCQLYGYCAEDRRVWKFDSESCEPIYNTCQIFKKNDGSSISYLANTLDYASCSLDNAGCKGYAASSFGYSAASNTVSWLNAPNSQMLYFDKDAEECDEENEGCHQFIRIKSGANLIFNSSFETDDTIFSALGTRITNESAFSGNAVFNPSGPINSFIIPLFSNSNASLNLLAGEPYVFSLYAKECGTGGEIIIGSNSGIPGDNATSSFSTSQDWQRFSVSKVFAGGSEINISIIGGAGTNYANCRIDAFKLEKGNSATAYSDYLNAGIVYEKLIPSYLENLCYEDANNDGFKEKTSNAPSKCDDYARTCTEREVGCDLYSQKDSISIPAKIKTADYCPEQCVGFNTYLQGETFFETSQDENFIPKTAGKCPASAVGCDEFTNLDALEKGGESREYYSFLKQCRLPDDMCEEFYTWEGDSETGYQLKVFSMQREAVIGADGPEPYTTDDEYEGMTCDSVADYNLIINPNCREFYNKSGVTFYKFLPLTITCSEDCKPFRRTIVNSACPSGADCCPSGGTWDDQQNSCIYMAIPGEGKKCSAGQAGCREYSGSSGNNIRILLQDNFEGQTSFWSAGSLDSESIAVGEHSLYVENSPYSTSRQIGTLVTKGKSYTLRFIAKANTSVILTASIGNATNVTNFNGAAGLTNSGWDVYELNLPELDHDILLDESLSFSGTGQFYIDNIRLIEITDRYYLIKDSWKTPFINGRDICNWNPITNQAEALYSLGCNQYIDSGKNKVNLKSFTEICQDSSVGCEAMVDTHNSNGYNPSYYNDGGDSSCASDGNGCVNVPADNLIFAVYDEDMECNRSDKGCQRLGKETKYSLSYLYEDKYLKNNPDAYEKIMCAEDENGCEEWSSGNGTAYFKDPGNQACEYRQKKQTGTQGWGWYKKKVKRCDMDNNGQVNAGEGDPVCLTNSECGSHKCIIDENDYDCFTDFNSGHYKTIGFGGVNLRVSQPDIETFTINGNTESISWAGICPAEQSGCTEYIDPISDFNANVINNPNFDDLDGNSATVDRWTGGNPYTQSVGVQPYTLYRLSARKLPADLGSNLTITLTCQSNTPDSVIYILDEASNELEPQSGLSYTLAIPSGERESSSLIFSNEASNCTISITNIYEEVQLKKAIVDYQMELEKNNECNGLVDLDNNCILFNERSQNGSEKNTLVFNSSLTKNRKPPANCEEDNCDSNTVLKVTPDRDCAKWLSCKDYTKDEKGNQVCYSLGFCESVDNKGECNGFVISQDLFNPAEMHNQVYPTNLNQDQIRNMTGYSKVGYYNSGANNPLGQNDLYPISTMKEIGNVTADFNGSFENFTLSGNCGGDSGCQPLAPDIWTIPTGAVPGDYFVISDPVLIQNKGVIYKNGVYAPEGKAILQVNEKKNNLPTSGNIKVYPNKDYVIGAYINTEEFSSSDASHSVTARISVLPYDSQGNLLSGDYIWSYSDNTFSNTVIRAASGKDWKLYVAKFQPRAGVDTIRIRVNGHTSGVGTCNASTGSCQKPFYVDNITINPALITKDLTPADTDDEVYWNELQSCRLYPKEDSLSCNYEDKETKLDYKGWWGYCLEHDRYPGDENACLLWYPIDRVNGDNAVNEMMSYEGRFPIYYCLSTSARGCSADDHTALLRCDTMVKTVNENGENTIWNSRLSSGSNYYALNTGTLQYPTESILRNVANNPYRYNYLADYAPFGGMVTYPDNFNTPIYLELKDGNNNQPRIGSPYRCNSSQNCYRLRFQDGTEAYTSSLTIPFYAWMNRCDHWCNLSFTGISINHPAPGDGNPSADFVLSQNVTLAMGDNTLYMEQDADGSSSGHGCCTNRGNELRASLTVEGSTINLTTLANLTKNNHTEDLAAIECDGGGVDGSVSWPDYDVTPDPGSCHYGRFRTVINVDVFDRAVCQVNAGLSFDQSLDRLKRLYARGYGALTWQNGSYVSTSGGNWPPPSDQCPGNVRPVFNPANGLCNGGSCFSGATNDFCGVRPDISHIQVNGKEGNVNIVVSQSQSANLTFNSRVDVEQLPIKTIEINWGGGINQFTLVDGVNIRDRQDLTKPHSFFHVYNYWDLRNQSAANLECGQDCLADGWCTKESENVAYCRVKPSVRIMDSWDWCNGANTSPCPAGFEAFDGWVIVKSE